MGRQIWMKTLLLLGAIGLSRAYLDVGECPQFQTVPTFDIEAYLGRWYEIERYPNFEVGLQCVTADYGPLPNGNISVVNNAVYPNGSPSSVSGEAVATSTPGQLIVVFPEGYGFYNVLGVDYERYSCVYACEQIGDIRDQNAWVLAREPVLDADTRAEAEAVFTANGIDISVFVETYQGDNCTYVEPV